VSARERIAKGRPIGFDMAAAMREAERKMRAEREARTIHRTAQIAPLPAGAAPPVIDGRRDDAVWQAVKPLEPFLPYATNASATIQAATEVQVTYDAENLYLAIKCDEVTPQAIRALGAVRDDDAIWEGDSVDLFLSVGEDPAPYAHLIVNPQNLQWEDLVGDGLDRQVYDPAYRSATRIGENAWFLEMALPWKEIGIPAPKPGERRRANVCRQRMPGGPEWSCWSQAFEQFVEPESFGTWTF